MPEGLRALWRSNVPRFSSPLPHHHACELFLKPPPSNDIPRTGSGNQKKKEHTNIVEKKHCGKWILNEAAVITNNKYTDRALFEGRWLFMEIAFESGGIKNGWFILIKSNTKQTIAETNLANGTKFILLYKHQTHAQ